MGAGMKINDPFLTAKDTDPEVLIFDFFLLVVRGLAANREPHQASRVSFGVFKCI